VKTFVFSTVTRVSPRPGSEAALAGRLPYEQVDTVHVSARNEAIAWKRCTDLCVKGAPSTFSLRSISLMAVEG